MSFFGNRLTSAAPAAPPKKERGRHPANPYILYFQEMRKKYAPVSSRNIYTMAKELGPRWRNLPTSQKLHYRRLYIKNRANYGMKAFGGYKVASQAQKWNQWPKVARRNARISKKKQRELAAAAAAAAAEEAKRNAAAGSDKKK